MSQGTTVRTVDVNISIPRELWFEVTDGFDIEELRAEYDAMSCGSNRPDEEWILRECLLSFLAREAGLEPDNEGEIRIHPTGEVTVSRERAADGTFTGGSE